MNKGYILELCNVTKRYPKSGFSLNNVSFGLPYGAIMGFVGENGAGKTTTIGCILNALKIDGGSIKLFGEKLTDEAIHIREQIGVVFDASIFSGCLTPDKIGNIMANTYKRWDYRAYKKYLKRFKLPLEQRLSTFSKGMLMKLALSTAISHSPKLLILDEATSGLDPVVRDDILDVFLDFVQDEERSVFLSTHITSDLEKVADYITFIDNGQILLTAQKDDLIYKYGIIRCKYDQFGGICKEDIIAYRKRDYQIDILISDKYLVQTKYENLCIDNAKVDDILLLLTKGERG
jgi:ABC-2 type transport system ATP-binding protein